MTVPFEDGALQRPRRRRRRVQRQIDDHAGTSAQNHSLLDRLHATQRQRLPRWSRSSRASADDLATRATASDTVRTARTPPRRSAHRLDDISAWTTRCRRSPPPPHGHMGPTHAPAHRDH